MSSLPVVFLMGPTASGKTDLAIKLRQQIPCEVISVDSALIYKGMDIGTAKPSAEELALAPHRLIDILDPSEVYSAADFRRDALAEIEDIHSQNKVPILVGGTMMYYKALLEGLSPLPPADAEIRKGIELDVEAHGWQALHDELAKIDPVSAARIHPNDPQRLMRAIEVFRISGQSLTTLTEKKLPPLPYHTLQFAIAPTDRKKLHERIELRFRQMLDMGFEDEVRKLYQREDLHLDLPSIRCVGYRQMWEYFDGKYDYDEMIYRGIVATRQLAKRQLTWLRSWNNINWLETGVESNLQAIVSKLG